MSAIILSRRALEGQGGAGGGEGCRAKEDGVRAQTRPLCVPPGLPHSGHRAVLKEHGSPWWRGQARPPQWSRLQLIVMDSYTLEIRVKEVTLGSTSDCWALAWGREKSNTKRGSLPERGEEGERSSPIRPHTHTHIHTHTHTHTHTQVFRLLNALPNALASKTLRINIFS